MKDDFRTIPDFPKYEINSEGVVRNRRTKCHAYLKRIGNSYFVQLRDAHGKIKRRSPKVLVAHIFDSAPQIWHVIPSLPNYEISKRGIVRHVHTKQIKKFDGCMADFSWGKRHKHGRRSKASLLSEVFGKKQCSRQHRISCILRRGGTQIFFENMRQAGRFLMRENFFSLSYFSNRFSQREKEICGWLVTYLDEDNIGKHIIHKLNVEARRQEKLHGVNQSSEKNFKTPCKKVSSCGNITLPKTNPTEETLLQDVSSKE